MTFMFEHSIADIAIIEVQDGDYISLCHVEDIQEEDNIELFEEFILTRKQAIALAHEILKMVQFDEE